MKTSHARIQELLANTSDNSEFAYYVTTSAGFRYDNEGQDHEYLTFELLDNAERGWYDESTDNFNKDEEGDDFLISWWTGSNTESRVASSESEILELALLGTETHTNGCYSVYESFYVDTYGSTYIQVEDNTQQNMKQEIRLLSE